MLCNSETGTCRLPLPDDFDYVVLQDILKEAVTYDVTSGWVTFSMTKAEAVLLLKLVQKHLEA